MANTAFSWVLRELLFEDNPVAGDPLIEDEAEGRARLGIADREQIALAAEQRHLRLGMASGECGSGQDAGDRAVEYSFAVGQREPRDDGAAENQDAVDFGRQG